MNKNLERATFAAGCFWGVEELFRELSGVAGTRVGYTGGDMERPSYEDVSSGTTGHAEAVEITFDPSITSYEDLLKVFWENHDPTTRNRQGPDVGEQYRSAIFYHTDEQRRIAEDSKRALERSGKYKDPIVTEIAAAGPFHEAQEHHQKYLHKRGLKVCH